MDGQRRTLHRDRPRHRFFDNGLIERELSLLGIEAAREPADTLSDPIRLKQAARRSDVDAAIAVSVLPGSPPEAMLRLYLRKTDKVVLKSWTVSSLADEDAAVITAIRSVDTLKAALAAPPLMPSAVAPTTTLPDRNDVPSVDIHRAAMNVTPVAPNAVSLSAGPSIGGTPAHSPLFFGVDIAAGWRPFERFGFALSATYLPLGENEKTDGIEVELRLLAARAWVSVWLPSTKRLFPHVALGGGSQTLFFRGVDAPPSLVLERGSTTVPVGSLKTGLSVAATAWIHIKVEVNVGIAPKTVLVTSPARRVSQLGPLLLDGALSVAFLLPRE